MGLLAVILYFIIAAINVYLIFSVFKHPMVRTFFTGVSLLPGPQAALMLILVALRLLK